ncbi:prepilin peptidase [Paenibacillus dendritiformis]|uniref:prepilin peptidase n=1 Tax=Paenibacillus TaxID=44249 RepID=UPI001B01F1BD|nr:A24 family peptidase [Paenibacillus dendritiformis]GIO80207.1 prepilin peptidase [Paenibacillus dendritiformis]
MEEMIIMFGLGMLLLYLSFYDIRQRIIPNRITYPILIVFLTYRIIDDPVYLWGLVPAAALAIVFLINPNCIGGGDIKMFACIGLMVGIDLTLSILFWLSVAGFIYLLFFRWVKKEVIRSIPLAPFAAFGFMTAMLLNTGI